MSATPAHVAEAHRLADFYGIALKARALGLRRVIGRESRGAPEIFVLEQGFCSKAINLLERFEMTLPRRNGCLLVSFTLVSPLVGRRFFSRILRSTDFLDIAGGEHRPFPRRKHCELPDLSRATPPVHIAYCVPQEVCRRPRRCGKNSRRDGYASFF